MSIDACPGCGHPTAVYRDAGNRNHNDGCPLHLERVARQLFETDPSSKMETSWENLAAYKRDGWRRLAEIAITRETS